MKNVIARVILILFLITALGAGVLFGAYKYLDSVDYDAKIKENIGRYTNGNVDTERMCKDLRFYLQ